MNQLLYELENLSDQFIEMLHLVKKQFTKSVDALISYNTDLAEEIIRTEQRVNASELNIEKECENIIALFQPVATELRYVLAIFKSVSELERIGDHAEAFSKVIIDNKNPFDKELLDKYSLYKMFEYINQMYDDIIISFETKNSAPARQVFKKDKEINTLYKKAMLDMKNDLKNQNPKSVEIFTLFTITARLERTGDLLTNIAEEIIFYLDAETLKHHNKLKRSRQSK